MLGEKIKTARLKQHYKQYELAGKAGISSIYLSEIERGIKNPSLETLEKIANALGLKVKSLL